MTIPRALLAALGALASLATISTLFLEIALAQILSARPPSTVKGAAIVAAIFETGMLVVIVWLISRQFRPASSLSGRWNNVSFAMSIVLSVAATAASVAMLVSMGKVADNLPAIMLTSSATTFIIGSGVSLGLAFAAQQIFVVVHFVLTKMSGDSDSFTVEHARFPQMQVKSVPYDRTVANVPMNTRDRRSVESRSPPGSSSGRSASETISSIRTSLSHHVVRPITSRTRLLSTSSRSGRRPPSLDSVPYRDRSSMTDDGFDSWDTSAVDPSSRQMVLETSPVPGRFLETIPASPTTSRSPSPGCALDLEPPPKVRPNRSRSYSPAPGRVPLERPTLTQHASTSELHIHPLFRSDSPVPPPAASANTMVIASPNAGQTISERSLTRMRSGSLPAASPLSRQSSYDSFRKKTPSPNASPLLEEPPHEERKMTPPIPEWILSAGSRTSLTEYHVRRQRDKGDDNEASAS